MKKPRDLTDILANRYVRLLRRCPSLSPAETKSAAVRLVCFQDGDPIRGSKGPGAWRDYGRQMDDRYDMPVRLVRLPLP